MNEYARESIRVEDGVLDRGALDSLLELTGGDTAFMAELIDTFLEEAPALVSEMQRAVAAGDALTLRRASHTLKSNCRTFGALHLGDLCQQIEELAVSARVDDAAPLVDRAAAGYHSVGAALRAEREAS